MSKVNMPAMSLFGASNPGLRRPTNEDAFLSSPELGICALADGMGGASAGELASSLFVETTIEVFSQEGGESEEETVQLVHTAFRLANERILTHAWENPDHRGMGCTAELLTFFNQRMILGHVGDSRTYILRDGMLKRLTQDHSLVQDQLDQGIISADEAKMHSLRHVILRAVGVKEDLKIDIIRGKAMPGDIFLLCSDGLTDMVEDTSIREVLSLPLDLHKKGERLIELANEAGGHDNITVVLCEIHP